MKSCRELTEMISQGMEGQLSWSKRMMMKMQLWMCKMMCKGAPCHNYEKQVHFVDQVTQEVLKKQVEQEELGPEARARIKDSFPDQL